MSNIGRCILQAIVLAYIIEGNALLHETKVLKSTIATREFRLFAALAGPE